jgi:hypothetical protein
VPYSYLNAELHQVNLLTILQLIIIGFMQQESIIPKLIGTWKLVSIYYKTPNNEKVDMYGKDPRGILTYDRAGYMNAQLSFSGRSYINKIKSKKKNKTASFDTYMAYYGKYYEKEPGVVIHDIEGCMKPLWEGSQRVRYIKLTGDTLYITSPENEIEGVKTKIEVFWERVENRNSEYQGI